MKNLIKLHLLVSLFLTLTAVSAFPQTVVGERSSTAFLGSVNGNEYRNDYFGFGLSFPKGWKVNDQEVTSSVTRAGLDVTKGNNERSNRALEESIKNEVVLLNVTKLPVGALGNAMFMMAVRKQASSAVTPSMVAEATKSAFTGSPTVKVASDTRVVTIAGKKFARVDFGINVNGQTATVLYYVTMIDGFAVTFSLSYADESDLAELDKIRESLNFSSK